MASLLRNRQQSSFTYNQIERANQLVQEQYPHLQLNSAGIQTIKEYGQEDLAGAVDLALWKNQLVSR